MACKCFQKSSLAAHSTTDQPITAGGLVSFATNRILTGTGIRHFAGSPSIELKKPGLYLVAFDGTFTIGTAGSAVAQLYNNGIAVPGVEDTVSGTTAVPRGMHFTTIVEVKPSCCAVDNATTLTVGVDVDGNFGSSAITVAELDKQFL